MKKTYKINEIFYSIQGEGYRTGTPVIFIRFSGCNLNCSFCDTQHLKYKEYNIEEILNELKKYPCKNIVLTGGEPMLQLDHDLIIALKTENYILQIETNGTIDDYEILRLIDFITVSPKEKWKLTYGNELKLVYQNQQLKKYYLDTNFEYYYLQPCSMKNISETIKAIKENPKWKLSLQTQKLINIK